MRTKLEAVKVAIIISADEANKKNKIKELIGGFREEAEPDITAEEILKSLRIETIEVPSIEELQNSIELISEKEKEFEIFLEALGKEESGNTKPKKNKKGKKVKNWEKNRFHQ